jgi:dihydrofolate synthase/folylpolyglutamate synthase
MPSRAHLAELLTRGFRGIALGLGRVEAALDALGHPERAFDAIHVAGSNGKGSVCAMVERVGRAAGLRTGLYTSPHLCRFAERIQLGGAPIDEAAFDDALGRVLRDGPPELTFFETLTVTSYVAFREAEVELAVIEVGLGGRFDATNTLARSIATAVTSISLEHQNVLGDTEAAIAREKAGIFRPGVPVVVGPVSDEAAAVLTARARERAAGPVTWVSPRGAVRAGDAVEVEPAADEVVTISPPPDLGAAPVTTRLGLAGEHQADNAAVATALCWASRGRYPMLSSSIAEGLREARWPGRLEAVPARGGEVTVLLDAAHNPAGISTLCRHLDRGGYSAATTQLVFGALAEKTWAPGLAALAERCGARLYARPKGRPAADIEEMARRFPGRAVGEGVEAVTAAIAGAPRGGTVLVTGSIYLVGEVRAHLFGIEPDPVLAL